MTDRSKLLALAEAVENLTGPDRRIDCEIQLFAVNKGRLGVFESADEWLESATKYGWGYKRYTAHLDAALSLVPEDYDWAVFRTNGGLTVHAWCGSRDNVFGETPALALTAAALRAQAEALS